MEGKYTLHWFDGSGVPLNVSQRIDESILTSQDEDEDPMYNEASDESDSYDKDYKSLCNMSICIF